MALRREGENPEEEPQSISISSNGRRIT